ncbi:branched-chain amino acid ABC transporter substrate-binding protein [Burkholderia anthina]|uniref:branched-chain amino acid ABC transporter substrate-binding protein n=1 Tax=Burkholderia anthina TaxID=179879 RepID=UPI001FC8BAAF|nr:branched-chain amino acid ABC transporter substrate-binding protein [Burkholderia anthina]
MNRIVAMYIALTAAACVTAPAHAQDPGAAATVVKLGFASPLTGAQAHLGKDNENGARLAVEEINATGFKVGGKPVRLELVPEDDAGDPRTGTVVAQQLVDLGVVAVVGHMNSGVAIPASRVYSNAQIALLSSASNPAYTTQGYKTSFRLTATDASQGPALAQYAAGRLHARRVVVVDDASAFGQGLADEFAKKAKALGLQIVSRETVSDKSIDFRAVLTRIKSERADAIMFGGMDATAGPLAKQARTLGLALPILGGDGICTPTMISLADKAAENIVCSSVGAPLDKLPRGAAFEQAYEARYGTPVKFLAPFFYDAVYLVADAMRRSGSIDRAAVLAALPKADYVGVTGRFAYTDRGDIKDPVVTLYTVKGGKLVPAETVHM